MQVDLADLVEALPGLGWAALPDGRAERHNRRWLDYAGMAAEQASGWGWADAIHPEDRRKFIERWQSCLATGTGADTEGRMRRFDGAYRWFLFHANPLRDGAGNITRWFGTHIDIEDRRRARIDLQKALDEIRNSETKLRQATTESRLAEEALNRARSELAHVSRVAVLNALTASIAHEVNQPLSGIITNASTCIHMLSGNPLNLDGARETIRRTLRDGNRAKDVGQDRT